MNTTITKVTAAIARLSNVLHGNTVFADVERNRSEYRFFVPLAHNTIITGEDEDLEPNEDNITWHRYQLLLFCWVASKIELGLGCYRGERVGVRTFKFSAGQGFFNLEPALDIAKLYGTQVILLSNGETIYEHLPTT